MQKKQFLIKVIMMLFIIVYCLTACKNNVGNTKTVSHSVNMHNNTTLPKVINLSDSVTFTGTDFNKTTSSGTYGEEITINITIDLSQVNYESGMEFTIVPESWHRETNTP